jgi:hypothetical protein
MCFSAAASSENVQGSINLASNIAAAAGVDEAIQSRGHPFMDGMLNPPLNVLYAVAGVACSSYHRRLRSSVTVPSWRIRLSERDPQERPPRAFPATNGGTRPDPSPIMTRASEPPIKSQRSMTAANDLAVRRALEAAGVEFIDENGGGAGVRLRKPRLRAPDKK